MKKLLIVLLALSTGLLFACKKNKDRRSEYPNVYLNTCFNKTYTHDKVELCFNSVESDSRCPINAVCITEGAAIAKFTFKRDGKSHQLTLSTNPLNIPYAKDTAVDGYRIEFIDLHPYPYAGQPAPSPSRIVAEVAITKL
ncbi:MAG: hypothetical protein ABIR18_13365 [Chitinophagaceae bacterium]